MVVCQYMKTVLNGYFCCGLEDHEPNTPQLQIRSALNHCATLHRTNRWRKESQMKMTSAHYHLQFCTIQEAGMSPVKFRTATDSDAPLQKKGLSQKTQKAASQTWWRGTQSTHGTVLCLGLRAQRGSSAAFRGNFFQQHPDLLIFYLLILNFKGFRQSQVFYTSICTWHKMERKPVSLIK